MNRCNNFVKIDEHSYLDISKIVGFELRKNERHEFENQSEEFRWLFFINSSNKVLTERSTYSFPFSSEKKAIEWIKKLFKE